MQHGGMPGDKVRVVSDGKAGNRQVLKGKSGDGAEPNRRVTLVVDHAGASAS